MHMHKQKSTIKNITVLHKNHFETTHTRQEPYQSRLFLTLYRQSSFHFA